MFEIVQIDNGEYERAIALKSAEITLFRQVGDY
jgi:hypothetical protein